MFMDMVSHVPNRYLFNGQTPSVNVLYWRLLNRWRTSEEAFWVNSVRARVPKISKQSMGRFCKEQLKPQAPLEVFCLICLEASKDLYLRGLILTYHRFII